MLLLRPYQVGEGSVKGLQGPAWASPFPDLGREKDE